MTRPQRFSYLFILVTLVLTGGLHLATPFLVVLFSYFALEKFRFTHSKALSILLFGIMVTAIFYGFIFSVRQAAKALPEVVETTLPKVLDYARNSNLTLPFDDVDSLKVVVMENLKGQLKYVGTFARFATKEFLFVLIGIVVAISMFLNSNVELGRETHRLRNNLYSVSSDFISDRFAAFYQSFKTVMGAQLIISTLNAAFTSVFVWWTDLPYPIFVIALTFLCGLLPIIGNLISNVVIVGIAFTRTPQFALVAIIYLVVIHKLEYFLNSKIIGERIKNPMWLTLLSMVLAERLMGLPGMILAPVILNYLKVEASKIEVAAPTPEAASLEPTAPLGKL